MFHRYAMCITVSGSSDVTAVRRGVRARARATLIVNGICDSSRRRISRPRLFVGTTVTLYHPVSTSSRMPASFPLRNDTVRHVSWPFAWNFRATAAVATVSSSNTLARASSSLSQRCHYGLATTSDVRCNIKQSATVSRLAAHAVR